MSDDDRSIMRWLLKMPNPLSGVLLVGAILSALAVHDELGDLRDADAQMKEQVTALRIDVAEIKRAVLGTLASR